MLLRLRLNQRLVPDSMLSIRLTASVNDATHVCSKDPEAVRGLK